MHKHGHIIIFVLGSSINFSIHPCTSVELEIQQNYATANQETQKLIRNTYTCLSA